MSDLEDELKNRIPRSKTMQLRLLSAQADLALILQYLKMGAYDDGDIESIDQWAENLMISLNEMRMNFEVSASARTIEDKQYYDMVDAFLEEEEDDD